MVETTTMNQISSPFHLFKPYLLCVSILIPSIVFTSFLGLGGFYVSLFTTTILILSTSFLVKFLKKTKLQVESEDEVDQEEVLQQPSLMNNTVSEAAQESDNDIVNEFQVDEPLDLTSESDQSSDDSGSSINLQMNWMISGNVEQNPEISDEYSTSEDDYDDEEGLIEIAIPSNDSNYPTFLPESILQQQDLVELLAKVNEVSEEENLIEIDISMGFIKCPSFQIEA